MKKILSLLLIAVMLLACLVACGDDSERISSSGELGDDALKDFFVDAWNEGASKNGDSQTVVTSSDGKTFSEFKDILAQGGRFLWFSFRIKDVKELEGKKLSKITFTIEADRDVSVFFSARCGADKDVPYQEVKLTANTVKNVTIDFENYADYAGKLCSIYFGDDAKTGYAYGTAAFEQWSQAEYKITNFKVICK